MSVFYVLSIKFVRHPFHSHFNFCYFGLKNSSVSRLNLVALLSFIKMSNTPLSLFYGLLISTEKLVLESFNGMMRALRILSYKMLLFIYSVLI